LIFQTSIEIISQYRLQNNIITQNNNNIKKLSNKIKNIKNIIYIYIYIYIYFLRVFLTSTSIISIFN
ncbi:MAG: hypothetical protein MCS20_02265, partial [Candidatus Phytoplasma mali]|nr:hypothetical protein [Candidatus Phytoplasma australiense]MCG7202212.1 hypothetical protein [Candidatus Phytoplasma mali]MCZ8632353.1 hypothetical protein [Spiroplasma sp. Tabriz.8]